MRFKVDDLMLEDGEAVCVTGAVPQLGTWQPDQMLELARESFFFGLHACFFGLHACFFGLHACFVWTACVCLLFGLHLLAF